MRFTKAISKSTIKKRRKASFFIVDPKQKCGTLLRQDSKTFDSFFVSTRNKKTEKVYRICKIRDSCRTRTACRSTSPAGLVDKLVTRNSSSDEVKNFEGEIPDAMFKPSSSPAQAHAPKSVKVNYRLVRVHE